MKRGHVVAPDRVIFMPISGSSKQLKPAVRALKAGVTEVAMHPAKDSVQLRESDVNWEGRVADFTLLCEDPELVAILESEQVRRIGYRELRDVQRSQQQ